MEPYEAHGEGTNMSSGQLNFSEENDRGCFGEALLQISEVPHYNEPEAAVSFRETAYFKKKKS